MMWRIAAGTAVSLFTGVAVTIISMFFGMILGAIAGYSGGIVDRVISAVIDLVWGFPVILVAVIFVGDVEPGSDRGHSGHQRGQLGRVRPDRARPGHLAEGTSVCRSGPGARRARRGRSFSAT